MGTVPPVTVWSAGQYVTSTQMNTIGNALNFLLSPPRVGIYRNASSSWAAGTAPTVINSWNSVLVNTDSCWSSGSPSRLVCNTTGLYDIEASVHFAQIADTGGMQMGVALNSGGSWPGTGSTNRLQEEVKAALGATTFGNSMNTKFTYFLNAGDYIEVYMAHNTTNSWTAFPSGTYFDGHFAMRWVAQN